MRVRVTCSMLPSKYAAKFGLEPRLPGFRVHRTLFHIDQPLKGKSPMLSIFKAKREELGDIEKEAKSSLCWAPDMQAPCIRSCAKLRRTAFQ